MDCPQIRAIHNIKDFGRIMKNPLKVLVFLKVLHLKYPASKERLSWHSQNGIHADFYMSFNYSAN